MHVCGRYIGKGGLINGPLTESWPNTRELLFLGVHESHRAPAVSAVYVSMLCRVSDEEEFRFDVCKAVNGAYIELH